MTETAEYTKSQIEACIEIIEKMQVGYENIADAVPEKEVESLCLVGTLEIALWVLREFVKEMDVPSKRTKADRIRAMSVDEMAKQFAEQTWRVCPPLGNGCQSGLGFGCKKCWLDWLNQEVSE